VTSGCIEVDADIEHGIHIFIGSKAKWETIKPGRLKIPEKTKHKT